MTGGAAALMGSIFLGPRTGRFTPAGSVVDMPGHSTVLAALGTFILWFGWYGFNPVSTIAFEYMVTQLESQLRLRLLPQQGDAQL